MLHTGDFKMDQFPMDRRITDLTRFARLGEEGVDLFLTDSTNAEVPGFTTAEKDLGARDRHASSATAPKRIVVSSFASHVHRIQQVLDTAHKHGRKVAFVGRSMVRNMGIASDLGYLNIPQGPGRRPQAARASCTDNKIVLICTGSQGEPMAALSRMANRDHIIQVGEGDTILLASSLIPGNENAIYGVINGLIRWGATSCTRATRRCTSPATPAPASSPTATTSSSRATCCPCTASGATSRRTPTWRSRTGVPADRVLVAEDGVVVDLDRGRAQIAGASPRPTCSSTAPRSASRPRTPSRTAARSPRRATSRCSASSTRTTQKLVDPVEFIPRGFVEAAGWQTQAEDVAATALEQAAARGRLDGLAAEQAIEEGLSRWFLRRHRRTPVITTVVVDAD